MAAKHYFAYGSNMNVARVRARGMGFTDVQSGRLCGYELLFDKVGHEHDGRAHANISPRSGCTVEGVLYGLTTAAEITVMDHFERTPINYSRDVVTVETVEGPISAWTYFANPAVRRAGCRPERTYLDHLLAGAPFLSADYLARLQAVEVIDG